MAEKKSSEALKVMNLKQKEKVVWTKTQPQKAAVTLNPTEEFGGTTPTEPWFKPKAGSVFPVKKRLVKTMMFDYIVKSFRGFHFSPPSSAGNFQLEGGEGNSCFIKTVLPLKTVAVNKKKKIQAYPKFWLRLLSAENGFGFSLASELDPIPCLKSEILSPASKPRAVVNARVRNRNEKMGESGIQ
ncbi:hypothetical protein FNV43_RR23105 [Rhamnella rubrinervis]|uniref:Uncharacterized protein n=1 Tax=Rhamnella rubrinervis TaxID=2594499 RepID=A0A8K0DVJ4_9ROSA|nr:hypothetical protein FNV43_RR23105 [Rhamnella rubrinervis]